MDDTSPTPATPPCVGLFVAVASAYIAYCPACGWAEPAGNWKTAYDKANAHTPTGSRVASDQTG